MNTQGPNSWPSSSGSGLSPTSNEQGQSQHQPRPSIFGPNAPVPQPSQINNSQMLQQPTSFFSSQANGHNLPSQQIPTQSSSIQNLRGPSQSQEPQRSPSHVGARPVQTSGYNLPNLGPVLQQQPSQQELLNHEREIERERERERQMREQRMQQDILVAQQQQQQQQRYEQEQELIQHQREQQARELQHRDHQQQPHSPPRENHTGAIPIQQPVASRVPATLHGPNGILNDQHPAGVPAPPQTSGLQGGMSGSVIYGNGAPIGHDSSHRSFTQPLSQTAPSQQLLGFSNATTPQQVPNNALAQGQQPILNDALSYLDQVKVRFQHEPDVYNRFLDIMKDFKSQAIDTPGVIDRVSGLFTGYPELIQGFNTFLPPGYRIECGTDNAIRVTTPMGTTVQQMPMRQERLTGGPNGHVHENGRRAFFGDGHSNEEWSQQQEAENGSQHHFPALTVPHINSDSRLMHHREEDANAILAHEQEQRGVSHLVSAASTSGAQDRAPPRQSSPASGQNVAFSQGASGLTSAALASGGQIGIEKRGPVEFNHAIGYVNKIKNRFAQAPEIYKQFLEILQTYQRESKPIQDVYAQVTQLFSSAPDLLEDFKQFLPESAAQAKAQAQAAAKQQMAEDAAVLSNVRGDGGYNPLHHTQAQTPRPEMKMPPVGNFAPPSASKENKKRRGGPGSQITGGAAALDNGPGTTVQNSRNGGRTANGSKRVRTEQIRPVAPEAIPVSPTLIPALPIPLLPSKDTTSQQDQLAFFDRVKKLLSNKQTFNEFLKLCNLFTQDLIDKNQLMTKAYPFIGGNSELTAFLGKWIQYTGEDDVIENRPRIPGDKVVLSNCRGLGPSYRLLPKRERLRACQGRDEICHEVLNDTWVSHPTWASEDSGFVAHRKNVYEEQLHRIEEERHDYDINIEACLRSIQLMDPINQQIQSLSKRDQLAYGHLPPGIGGQSETIYKRVIRKIYGRERGNEVINDLLSRPSACLPTVLGRLKQKVEEWKASQREWEKVWREQTNRIFWKSLDHQGIQQKNNDRRVFQPKSLYTELQTKYEEQRRLKAIAYNKVPNYQLKYTIDDIDVLHDACHLILTALLASNQIANDLDKSRLESFIKTFIPTFFDLDRDVFESKMSDVYDTTTPNEDAEEESATDADASVLRGRRAGGRKSNANLLRGVLERGKNAQKDDIVSKESTPDVQSNGEDTPASTGTPSENVHVDSAEHRWLSHPATGNKTLDLNTPFKRDNFHLYGSQNIYCFVRMFEMLYDRLVKLKAAEKQVQKDVQRSMTNKASDQLGIADKKPTDFFADVSPTANYYSQMLQIFEDGVRGDIEESQWQETLRRYYMQAGWQMYGYDKMLSSLLRFGLAILISDNKDKSLDIINLFYKDRKEDETTHQTELTYRKQVEKLLTREAELLRIRYHRPSQTITISLFDKTSKTYEADELAAHARWSYYVSAFSMLDHTEGIDANRLRRAFSHRALQKSLSSDDEEWSPIAHEDGLVIRISPNNYHLLYDPGTTDWWVHGVQQQKRGLSGMKEQISANKAQMKAMVEDKARNRWMTTASAEQIHQINDDFALWMEQGPPDVRSQKAALATTDSNDQVMEET